MKQSRASVRIYIEVGNKRTVACALEWPGWCRSARNETAAVQALLTYGARYARVIGSTELEFEPLSNESGFLVVERLKGNATTDFGAPAVILAADSEPLDGAEAERSQSILRACWKAFDTLVVKATGKELQKGPRGGGRDLKEIVQHVQDAELAYLSRIGVKANADEPKGSSDHARQTVLDAVTEMAGVGKPEPGPRGGERWPMRYFVRRVAWHVLDHAWEIEDRII